MHDYLIGSELPAGRYHTARVLCKGQNNKKTSEYINEVKQRTHADCNRHVNSKSFEWTTAILLWRTSGRNFFSSDMQRRRRTTEFRMYYFTILSAELQLAPVSQAAAAAVNVCYISCLFTVTFSLSLFTFRCSNMKMCFKKMGI